MPARAEPLLVEPVAEKLVDELPPGALFWRVERFTTLRDARAAEGRWSIAAEAWGQAWLFTLGPAGEPTGAGRKIAEVGPVPTPKASKFLLRVNRASGPPGASTPVHFHPGSEAFLVLRGELTQRTDHGVTVVRAGNVMNGHAAGTVMQLESTGAEPLNQLVMFVVDANEPFSTPAKFQSR
jgi:quercetin dioxygenase-like cupin family protein